MGAPREPFAPRRATHAESCCRVDDRDRLFAAELDGTLFRGRHGPRYHAPAARGAALAARTATGAPVRPCDAAGTGGVRFLEPRGHRKARDHRGAQFSYSEDGYVKDDEKIDADGLLASIKDNTEASNKLRHERGWDEMSVVGWQVPPHYDPQTNRLEWAVIGKDLTSNASVVNFNTRILGRGGVTSAVLIADPADLSTATDEFKSTLVGFNYVAGQRYAEYKEGDKIAKYGLAALVTGGAAAIAVKTGLWKVIVGAVVAGWKFIVAAFVALFGGIMRRFKKNA
jgi:hypothetical protein